MGFILGSPSLGNYHRGPEALGFELEAQKVYSKYHGLGNRGNPFLFSPQESQHPHVSPGTQIGGLLRVQAANIEPQEGKKEEISGAELRKTCFMYFVKLFRV